MDRRQAIAAYGSILAGLVATPLGEAIGPITRESKVPLRLSLAAYSMRKFLPDKRRDPNAKGKMDMLGFLDYGATLGIDGVELTSYFMPSPQTREAINELKLRAHMHGLDISGGAIGNNFTNAPSSQEGREQLKQTRAKKNCI